jgi:methyl-accepting chemotaxis protein
MFLRVHLPAKHDDAIERATLLRAMDRREMSAGKELGKSAFALRVGKPVIVEGRLVGYLELGEEIDHFLGRMKQQTGNEFAMFISKKLIDASEWARTRGTQRNTWDDFPDVVVVNGTTPDPMVDAEAVAAAGSGRTLDESTRDNEVFARAVFPVRDSTGSVVGGLVVRHDITALHSAMRAGLLQSFAFFACLAAAAAVLSFLFVDRLIFRRLRAMIANMEDASMRLAGGDFSVASTVKAASKDEIGRFEGFFANFLALVGNTLRSVVERTRQQARAPAPPPRPR